MEEVSFTPVWFESLGAKSSCTLVKTPDVSVVIDPGVAEMHPSFPASWNQKLRWREMGRRAIKKVCRGADVVVVTHYHYDHYLPEDLSIYKGKLLLAKNPNEYINDSQRKRAEEFLRSVCRSLGGVNPEDLWRDRKGREYPSPMDGLPLAKSIDLGEYNKRRRQLLNAGEKWFRKRVEKWSEAPEIPELRFDDIEVRYPEGKTLRFGETTIRLTQPMFHGLEFAGVGWVFSCVVERRGEKLLHSSDLDGPVVEDYARWIIDEDPGVLILDGPITYMLGYLLNKTNLDRAVRNACDIVKQTSCELIVYDHHLLRDPLYLERTKEAWRTAKRTGRRVTTASEYLGRKPKALRA